MRRTVLMLVLAGGCAPRAMTMSAEHPANPDAEAGRLAGPPAALRSGVVGAMEEAAPEPTAPAPQPGALPPTAPQQVPAAEKPSTSEAPTETPVSAPTKATPKTPASPATPAEKPAPPNPPAPTGHEGHH